MRAAPPRIARSAEDMERLGEALAATLRVGDVVVLSGALGAGKTRFVAGLARGLASKVRVRSPTFALVNEYQGRILLAHFDLYRVEAAETEDLGLDEYVQRAALVVEWGEKLPSAWRAEALGLDFSTGEAPGERRVVARASRGRGLALLQAWQTVPAQEPRSGSPT